MPKPAPAPHAPVRLTNQKPENGSATSVKESTYLFVSPLNPAKTPQSTQNTENKAAKQTFGARFERERSAAHAKKKSRVRP